jgi:hypothetical protein
MPPFTRGEIQTGSQIDRRSTACTGTRHQTGSLTAPSAEQEIHMPSRAAANCFRPDDISLPLTLRESETI